jgi:hypothetical protein
MDAVIIFYGEGHQHIGCYGRKRRIDTRTGWKMLQDKERYRMNRIKSLQDKQDKNVTG